MKEKKGKKGKKSLVDLKNFRSTRLKELARSLPSYFGANSTSIQKASFSDLPPIENFINKNVCKLFVEYISNTGYDIYGFRIKYETINYKNNLIPLTDRWYYFNNGFSSFSGDYSFNGQSGFLFIYFNSSVCGNCSDLNIKSGRCTGNTDNFGYDSAQGPGFAVLINSIAQINALNRTGAVQSSGSYLSNSIINALNSDNPIIKDVIRQIRESIGGDTTPLILYNPVHPLLVLGENYTNFSCLKNDNFSIFDYFIFIISFSANSNSLSLSDVMKLPFNVKSILGSDVAELGNNNTTIKFLSPGTCTIYYQIEPFNDVENIFKNPNGPSFYGVKGFSLRINVFLF
jgi:hypothetical protein